MFRCRFSHAVLFFFSFQNQYNLARAQQSYKSLVQIHEKNGKYILYFRSHLHGILGFDIWQ